MLWIILSILLCGSNSLTYRDEILVDRNVDEEWEMISDEKINPYGSLLPCDYLPSDYYQCQSVEDIHENDSRSCQKRNGRRFGGEKYAEVEHTSVLCQVYSGIVCRGNRTFLKESIPCLKSTSHDFLSTLFYSIFLGLFAVDRYSLGHIGIAVGKMITLGGLGLWWIIDIILLIFGKLLPADDSNWIQFH